LLVASKVQEIRQVNASLKANRLDEESYTSALNSILLTPYRAYDNGVDSKQEVTLLRRLATDGILTIDQLLEQGRLLSDFLESSTLEYKKHMQTTSVQEEKGGPEPRNTLPLSHANDGDFRNMKQGAIHTQTSNTKRKLYIGLLAVGIAIVVAIVAVNLFVFMVIANDVVGYEPSNTASIDTNNYSLNSMVIACAKAEIYNAFSDPEIIDASVVNFIVFEEEILDNDSYGRYLVYLDSRAEYSDNEVIDIGWLVIVRDVDEEGNYRTTHYSTYAASTMGGINEDNIKLMKELNNWGNP